MKPSLLLLVTTALLTACGTTTTTTTRVEPVDPVIRTQDGQVTSGTGGTVTTTQTEES